MSNEARGQFFLLNDPAHVRQGMHLRNRWGREQPTRHGRAEIGDWERKARWTIGSQYALVALSCLTEPPLPSGQYVLRGFQKFSPVPAL
jgi:hypothetical protein